MLLKLNGLERDFHNVWGHCWIMDGLKKRCQLYPHPQNIPCFGAIMVPRFNKTMSFSPDLFLVLTQQDSQHIYVGWRTTGKQPRFGHVYQKISDQKTVYFWYYWRVEIRKQFWKEMLIWTVVLQIYGKWLTPSQKLDLEEVLRTETSSCAKDTTTSCTDTCSFG